MSSSCWRRGAAEIFRFRKASDGVRQRTWILTVPLILAGGLASGWLSGSGYGNPWFDALAKPLFMPPGWVFPVAWTTLYILMGISLAWLIGAPSPHRRTAITLFFVQLGLNYLWSPVFFGAHRIVAGLTVILLLDAVLLMTIAAAWKVRRIAAAALLPYAAWLLLATALNLEIWRLNG